VAVRETEKYELDILAIQLVRRRVKIASDRASTLSTTGEHSLTISEQVSSLITISFRQFRI